MTTTSSPAPPGSPPTSSPADPSAAQRRVVSDRTGRTLPIFAGHPLPFGVSETRNGLNFAVFSEHATAMTLVVFATREEEPLFELALDPIVNRTGNVWHVEVAELNAGTRYGWRADRQPVSRDAFHRYDPRDVLVDPYATALSGGSIWGVVEPRAGASAAAHFPRRRSLYLANHFDWDDTRSPRIALADKVIYELHVRGFTRDPSSGVAAPGTYLGLVEKIPYLQSLGVTTVELLPVYEFDELENRAVNPLTGERLYNFWGYSPICFFAPKAAYAANGRNGAQVAEFKTMVREFHRAGLEVFLDVVFNHTAESVLDPDAPSLSFRGLDNSIYYILDPVTGAYLDYSGCGHTLNANHPVVRGLIIDALRYWVAEMRVDGFRFDLASILGRGRRGEVLAAPPVLERIAGDPVLADATLIAEAWDAAGLYQVGTFPAWGRWAEWNGPFRDQVRHFVRGDGGFTAALASRLAGSADLFQHSGRAPAHSINFITCHDGFTLADLVAYDRKHNEMNGEDNRDGAPDNVSWNCGAEGPTDDPAVRRLRAQQTRNLLTLLLLSQGTPMLLAGDELGRTQLGNNNAYCHDGPLSWIDWSAATANRDLFRFVQTLIAFRRAHPVLRHRDFLTGTPGGRLGRPDVMWHGVKLGAPDWRHDSRSLAMHLAGEHAAEPDCDVYLAANAWREDLVFALPLPPLGTRWVQVVDTAAPSPHDIAEPGREPRLASQRRITVRARSCIVLRSA
jgi:isoamylase